MSAETSKQTPPIVPSRFWREHKRLSTIEQFLLISEELGPFAKLDKDAPLYLVADADVIHHILVSDRDDYIKSQFSFGRVARFVGAGLLSNLSETWLSRRKLMQNVFTKDYLRLYGEQTIEQTKVFLQYWADCAAKDETIHLFDDMMMLVMTNVARYFLSDDVSQETARMLVKATADAQNGVCYKFFLTPWFPSPTYLRFKLGVWRIEQYVQKIIAARKRMKERPDDLMTLLVEAGLSDQDLLDEGKTALAAGHETTGTALTWCFHLLMNHPEYWEVLQAEVGAVVGGRDITLDDMANLPFVQAVWEESLRLYPPTWALPREAAKSCNLMGYRINKGARFMISPYTLHRSTHYWDDPNVFKPSRFMGANRDQVNKKAYIPFSTGPHMCIAKHLAMQQARLIIAMIAQRFNLTRVSQNSRIIPARLLITMQADEDIIVKLNPR